MKKPLIFLMALVILAVTTPAFAAKQSIMELPFFERSVLIIKKFETLHKPKHWPTICYGHVVQRVEHFTHRQYNEQEADAFFAETMPNSVSYMKSMGVTNIFLRLSPITLVPEPSTKVPS